MYAILEIAGQQFKVAKNDKIVAPRLDGEVGGHLEFDKVMMLADSKKVQVGTPFIDGARVQAKIMDHGQAKKVLVFKKKRRKGYRLFKGHRQQQTTLKIEKIIAGEQK
ncbi:50S ribosomal protein L21 [candidate division KSB1 bacterium]|nr:50S ribosomal protein L21 [candidate division KSB1 bacterium]